MGAAEVWLNSFQHSPNSPAHSKGVRTGRSMGELGKQLIQGRGLRTDNSLTWDLAPEKTGSYLGTFSPTRDSCSIYPCETQSQWR